MNKESIIVYKLKIGLWEIIDLIIGIVFIAFAYLFLTTFGLPELFFFLFAILFSFMGFISLGLFANYLTHSLRNKISIDIESEQITIESNYLREVVNFKEIDSVEIFESAEIGRFGYSYSYAKYYVKNKCMFIVNSFMTNSYFIPSGIKPIISNELFPAINWKNKKLEKPKTEYEELLVKYSNYSDQELEKIINSKNGYRNVAIQAANKIFNKRKNSA